MKPIWKRNLFCKPRRGGGVGRTPLVVNKSYSSLNYELSTHLLNIT